jgi:hypothetical protein
VPNVENTPQSVSNSLQERVILSRRSLLRKTLKTIVGVSGVTFLGSFIDAGGQLSRADEEMTKMANAITEPTCAKATDKQMKNSQGTLLYCQDTNSKTEKTDRTDDCSTRLEDDIKAKFVRRRPDIVSRIATDGKIMIGSIVVASFASVLGSRCEDE